MTDLSTGPRALNPAELAGAVEDGVECGTCASPPTAGTLGYDRTRADQPAVWTYECAAGHTWTDTSS
ncbi:hypothetical protein [Catenuloplanes indicus]|uniref:Uncharacterized protein n=1 Tax=Catenuloplanes indicus TaxID=137267 RepID=A0AAE3VTJ3_9ACTN|nr:hypothetical protein [Catenuloplanes indicus]MDQ0363399.1 hypothetical protein [Catenuloplanes indicus]